MTALTDTADPTRGQSKAGPKSGLIKRVLADAQARMATVLTALEQPAPAPNPAALSAEQVDALGEIAECGPVHSLVSYLSPRPGLHRGEPVTIVSGLYGVTALPQTLFAALRQRDLVTAGGAITDHGRASIAATLDLDFG